MRFCQVPTQECDVSLDFGLYFHYLELTLDLEYIPYYGFHLYRFSYTKRYKRFPLMLLVICPLVVRVRIELTSPPCKSGANPLS